MYFPDIFQMHAWVYHKILFYVQVDFTHDLKVAFLQQVIIWQNASCQGIFNCHYAPVTFIFICRDLYNFPKSGATDNLHIISKKLPGCNLVKAALKSLYRNFFNHQAKKKSRRIAGTSYVCLLFQF